MHNVVKCWNFVQDKFAWVQKAGVYFMRENPLKAVRYHPVIWEETKIQITGTRKIILGKFHCRFALFFPRHVSLAISGVKIRG